MSVSIATIKIDQAKEYVGKVVTLQGWVYYVRHSAKIVFPILRDGSGTMQCVAIQKSLPAETFELLKGLTQESSLTVTGVIRAEQRAVGGFELDIEGVAVLQRVPETDPYPITPKDHGIDFLLDHRHLWIRSIRQGAIARIRSTIMNSAQTFLNAEGFTLVNSPILTNLAFIGNDAAMKLSVADEETFLTQSGQPYLEAAAMALGKVYGLGPAFSAEASRTRRHLAEFWLVEPEIAFGTIEDAKMLAQNLIINILGIVLVAHREELKRLECNIPELEEAWTKRGQSVSYDQAVESVRAVGSETEWGTSFSGTDESLLTRNLTAPLIVERFPQSANVSRFSQAETERPELGLNFTMMAPKGYGEIISGGQRICEYAELMDHIPEDSPLLGWYADLRKYGTVPHAGFSMCIERVVAWICGLEHIRETVAFPRMAGRLTP